MRRQERHLAVHEGRMAISICLYGLSLMGIMAYIWVNPPHRTADHALQPEAIRLASEAVYSH